MPWKASDNRHLKRWGYEDWIVNNDLYCGKLLHFDKFGGQTSMHFHVKKHETMLCHLGEFEIIQIDSRDAKFKSTFLHPGDVIEIASLSLHRIVCLKDGSELLEFSTHHEDDDSYRVLP